MSAGAAVDRRPESDQAAPLMSRSFNVKSRRTRLRPARLAIAGLAALVVAGDRADAASARNERSVELVQSRTAGPPIMAVVSLRNQRVTIYDADGWTMRAPVSSGQRGRETPAGIFSVIQKEAEHYSNLYDDAYMPHMQRITWSGIALHGGPLPGHAASHGCVRMPYDFARRLFDETRIGMRVIVAPHDVAPVPIAHPALFPPNPAAAALAAARSAEAADAARAADQARLAAVKASTEAARARVPVRVAENLKARAEAQLAAAERALAAASSAEAKEQAEDAKAKVVARIAELQTQWATANAELQPKLDAVAPARQAAVAAEAARVAASEAAREVARQSEPVSVFISRKTQRLYVRQAFQPILEIPVTIQDDDRPIGTHIFTAMDSTDGGAAMRWSAVSLDAGHPEGAVLEPQGPRRPGRARDIEPISVDIGAARAALDRIAIPQEALDRISPMVSPRSSLIISDEGLSSETGNGTDFVVLMSGEPQGGIKSRRRHPVAQARYDRPRDRFPYWRSQFPFFAR